MSKNQKNHHLNTAQSEKDPSLSSFIPFSHSHDNIHDNHNPPSHSLPTPTHTGSESPLSVVDVGDDEDFPNSSFSSDNSDIQFQPILDFLTSWVNGTLDFDHLDSTTTTIIEFDLTPIEYQHLREKIEGESDSNPDIFFLFQTFIYSEEDQKLRMKMATQPAHQSPISDLSDNMKEAFRKRFLNYPHILTELSILSNTPFKFFSNSQYSAHQRQKKERREFNKWIKTRARAGSMRETRSQSHETARSFQIDQMYDSQEKPRGETRLPDLYLHFNSLAYPPLCLEIAWSQETKSVDEVAKVYLTRSRKTVKRVVILDLMYDRNGMKGKGNGKGKGREKEEKEKKMDKSTWVRVFKAGRGDRVERLSNIQIRSRDGEFVEEAPEYCVDLLYEEFLPRVLVESQGIGEDVLKDRWRISSRKMWEIVERGSRLQEVWRGEGGIWEVSSSGGSSDSGSGREGSEEVREGEEEKGIIEMEE